MNISLLIAVYKRADFLDKIFASLLWQTQKPHEVVICEDGESSSIKSLVQKWGAKLPLRIVHVTQKDQGNRKTLCVNKGISRAIGDYIITIDGDCVLHKDFIKAHAELSDEYSFLTGRRVELSEKASEYLTVERIKNGYLNRHPLKLYWDAIAGKTHHLGRFFKTPKVFRSILAQNNIHDIRGCNFSVYKKHLVSVNGYDNNFSGAYGEDSDLEYRLRHLGLKMKSVKGAAIQYHLWHATQPHDLKNQQKLQNTLHSKKIKAENGLKEAAAL